MWVRRIVPSNAAPLEQAGDGLQTGAGVEDQGRRGSPSLDSAKQGVCPP